jgi:hypothetical protein
MQKAPASATAFASEMIFEASRFSRSETDVADHRHSPVREKVDGFRHRFAALDLHRGAARLLHDPRCAGERLPRRGLIRPERHIDADQGMPAAAHHRGAVRAHHFHRDRDGRRQAVDHLAEAVADKQHVAMRIEQLRHPHRVSGQHYNRLLGLSLHLSGPDRRRCHALARDGRGRRPAGRSVDGEGRHGAPLAAAGPHGKTRLCHGPPRIARVPSPSVVRPRPLDSIPVRKGRNSE